jgi:hypothetical protein
MGLVLLVQRWHRAARQLLQARRLVLAVECSRQTSSGRRQLHTVLCCWGWHQMGRLLLRLVVVVVVAVVVLLLMMMVLLLLLLLLLQLSMCPGALGQPGLERAH